MQAFGNLRPCNFASESLVDISPLKASVCRGVDFTIIRELTGGIYFGARKEASEDGEDQEGDDDGGVAWDTEHYSRPEIERVARLAGVLATRVDPALPVWSLDKANVLATSRLWRRVVADVMAREFPHVRLGHQLIDSAAMLMVKNPRALNGVVVTSNLFGDIISDEASVIPGSLGLLPSASLSGIPDGGKQVNGIYEPIHGKKKITQHPSPFIYPSLFTFEQEKNPPLSYIPPSLLLNKKRTLLSHFEQQKNQERQN